MLRKRPTCPSRDDLWDIAGGRIKKLAFEIKISQYTYDCQASCFIDVNLQWKELRKIGKFWWAVESPISLLTPYIKMILGFSRIKHFETIIMW